MATPLGAARVLAAAGCLLMAGGLMAAGQLIAAPVAKACPSGFFSDPYTGQCYTPNSLPTVAGIPCIPGKSLGTCLGILQNQSPPGGGPPPGGPWP